MGIHCNPWASMPGYGYPCQSMGIHANLWVSMPVYGYPCQSIGIHANPWVSMPVHGHHKQSSMAVSCDRCLVFPDAVLQWLMSGNTHYKIKTCRRLKRTFAFSCCEHIFQATNIQIICQQTMIGMKSNLQSLQSVEKFRGRMQGMRLMCMWKYKIQWKICALIPPPPPPPPPATSPKLLHVLKYI